MFGPASEQIVNKLLPGDVGRSNGTGAAYQRIQSIDRSRVVKVTAKRRQSARPDSKAACQGIGKKVLLIRRPEPDILEIRSPLLGQVHHHAATLAVGVDSGLCRWALCGCEPGADGTADSHMAV